MHHGQCKVRQHKQGVWKQIGSQHSFVLFTKDGNYFGKDYIPFWLYGVRNPWITGFSLWNYFQTAGFLQIYGMG